MSTVPQSEAQAAAEAAWRAVVDAQCDDLTLLRVRWPDQTSEPVLAARARLRAREAPGGEADTALARLDEAYGGAQRVPVAVHERLRDYVWQRMGERTPWPHRGSPEYVEAERRYAD